MPAPSSLIRSNGALTATAVAVLHALADVPVHLLQHARIRRAQDNWLRAPWYPYHRGGAITIGRTIWFTRKWHDAEGYGDGSLKATWNWLQHLAHEVGHLPQAERYGSDLLGRSRYVAAFACQYAERAITFRRPVHDGAALEIEADMGRWVLRELFGDDPLSDPIMAAIHGMDDATIHTWLDRNRERLTTLQRLYRKERCIAQG